MKAILFLITVLFFSQSCTKQEMVPETNQGVTNRTQFDFSTEITKTYFQTWVSGVRGGGAGTNFYIEFRNQLPKEIVFGDLFFRNKKVPLLQTSDILYVGIFSNNEINPRDNILTDGVENRSVVSPLPIKDDEALLEYYDNGELNYYLITNVQEAQLEFYPE